MTRRPTFRPRVTDLSQIRSGDILLWRATTLCGRIIAACGRAEYSHVGMAAWLDGHLQSLDMLQWRGGVRACLADLVAQSPGRADWYQTKDMMRSNGDDTAAFFDRDRAVARMLRFIGKSYGWRAIAMVSLRHIPIVRLFCRLPPDTAYDSRPAFCSHAVAIACRAAGIDPVPNLCDRLTEPADLARSLLFTYKGTLFPGG